MRPALAGLRQLGTKTGTKAKLWKPLRSMHPSPHHPCPPLLCSSPLLMSSRYSGTFAIPTHLSHFLPQTLRASHTSTPDTPPASHSSLPCLFTPRAPHASRPPPHTPPPTPTLSPPPTLSSRCPLTPNLISLQPQPCTTPCVHVSHMLDTPSPPFSLLTPHPSLAHPCTPHTLSPPVLTLYPPCTSPPHITFWNPLLLRTLPHLPLRSSCPYAGHTPCLSLTPFSPTYSPPSVAITAKYLLAKSWALESDP